MVNEAAGPEKGQRLGMGGKVREAPLDVPFAVRVGGVAVSVNFEPCSRWAEYVAIYTDSHFWW